MKIVLDTIVPGSFGYDVWQAFRRGRYTLCVSTEILLEYEKMLNNLPYDYTDEEI